MKGSTYKRCRCRGQDGHDLGKKCPLLGRHGHGSWFYRIELEPDANGNRRTVRRGGFASQREAQRALDDARGKASRGVDVSRRLTVATFLTEWLVGKRNLRPTTMRSYRQHVEDVLVPHLGRIELAVLRPTHVEAMLEELLSDRQQDSGSGRRCGRLSTTRSGKGSS